MNAETKSLLVTLPLPPGIVDGNELVFHNMGSKWIIGGMVWFECFGLGIKKEAERRKIAQMLEMSLPSLYSVVIICESVSFSA